MGAAVIGPWVTAARGVPAPSSHSCCFSGCMTSSTPQCPHLLGLRTPSLLALDLVGAQDCHGIVFPAVSALHGESQPWSCLDGQLRTPMYFLLRQFSLMDLMLVCTTVPKMAVNFLSGRKSISLWSCLDGQLRTPMYFLLRQFSLMDLMLVCTTVPKMAVNFLSGRKSISLPLRYPVLMRQKLCVLLTAASWILGSLDGIIMHTAALSLSYCNSLVIHHFFCDVAALLPFSSTDMTAFERLMFICCMVMLIFSAVIIIASYSCVLRAVIHMGSRESRHKAFTTCSSHLLVVGLYYELTCLCT
ncbi:Olfactory receptor 2M4 [Heterocephalus glaber]|uniref:Olfactory receptor 2M4 n=1 Tax=Heterocephalus glaber TaxID=10181 RepID=G5BRI9_HETGA|nr:Olfactory receptor 2M4 [Heterocephalus glaber]